MTTLVIVMVLLVGAHDRQSVQSGDILEGAAQRPLQRQVQAPDGTWRTPAYGDFRLEEAVRNLAKHPRPWTVTSVLGWYGKAADARERADLLRVLAASRDPRAGVALGQELKDAELIVRIEAADGLMDYFLGYVVGGGTENLVLEVERWWKANRDRLEREANTIAPAPN